MGIGWLSWCPAFLLQQLAPESLQKVVLWGYSYSVLRKTWLREIPLAGKSRESGFSSRAFTLPGALMLLCPGCLWPEVKLGPCWHGKELSRMEGKLVLGHQAENSHPGRSPGTTGTSLAFGGGLGRPPNFPPHLFIKLPWRCTEHGHGAQRCRLTAGGISSSRLSPCLKRARCWHLPQNLGICTPLGAGATRQMNLNRCTFASVPAWLSPVVQDVASRSTELQQQELTRGNLFLLTGVFWKHWMASGQKGLLLFWNKHRRFEVLAQQRWRGA